MQYDVAVVGAGPAGITAALYLVRSGVSVVLVENSSSGGQILSTAEIENYPGFPEGLKGWELADRFEAHLAKYPVTRVRGAVNSISAPKERNKPFMLAIDNGKTLECKAVVICSGAHHRKLGAHGEAEFAGRGVSYCAVCDGNFYRGRDVAVVGGGNSAVEESLYLSRIVNKVYLIHRRQGFRAAQIYLDKVQATPNITCLTDTVVDEIRGNAQGVNEIVIRNVQEGTLGTIPVEGIFLYVGMQPANDFIPEGTALDKAGFIITDAEMCTSIPGLFAAGDIRSKHCRQVSTAVGDGATAATAALAYLEQYDA